MPCSVVEHLLILEFANIRGMPIITYIMFIATASARTVYYSYNFREANLYGRIHSPALIFGSIFVYFCVILFVFV